MIAGMDVDLRPGLGERPDQLRHEHLLQRGPRHPSHTYLYPHSGSQEAAIIADVSRGRRLRELHGPRQRDLLVATRPSRRRTSTACTNDGKYCLVVGNCCLTSTYDYRRVLRRDLAARRQQGRDRLHRRQQLHLLGRGLLVGRRLPRERRRATRPTTRPRMGAYDGIFHDHGEPMTQVVRDQRRARLLRQPRRDGVRLEPDHLLLEHLQPDGRPVALHATWACRRSTRSPIRRPSSRPGPRSTSPRRPAATSA